MAIGRKILVAVVALSVSAGAAAGVGVDPVNAVADQVCEPHPTNVTQDVDNASAERVLNTTDDADDPNVTGRRIEADEDMNVIEGSDLVRLALQEVAPDSECDVQNIPGTGSGDG